MADPAISIRVHASIKAHLEQQARRAGVDFSAYVRTILEEHVRSDIDADRSASTGAGDITPAELLAEVSQVLGELRQMRGDLGDHRAGFAKAVAMLITVIADEDYAPTREQAEHWVNQNLKDGVG